VDLLSRPSPDGKYLAFRALTFDSNVWVIDNFDPSRRGGRHLWDTTHPLPAICRRFKAVWAGAIAQVGSATKMSGRLRPLRLKRVEHAAVRGKVADLLAASGGSVSDSCLSSNWRLQPNAFGLPTRSLERGRRNSPSVQKSRPCQAAEEAQPRFPRPLGL